MNTIKRRFFAVIPSALTVALVGGICFIPATLVASAQTTYAYRATARIRDVAGRPLPQTDGIHGGLQRIRLAPQSSLSLLKRATRVGPHSENARISLIFGLKLRNVEKLKHFLVEVQDPRSAVYHQYLTPEEFTAEYGPTPGQVVVLKNFLADWGIKVTKISSNRLLVHTRGSTTAYEHALEIRVNDYRLDGRSFYSTEDSPWLPATIAPLVVNILGLSRGLQMHPLSRVIAHYSGVGPHAAPPPSTAVFNPHQIAKAYDWPDITDSRSGAGVSIAVLTALTLDVATNPNYRTFWSAFGLPDHTINVTRVGNSAGILNRNRGGIETSLDIEWSGAMAPGAALNVYVAANPGLPTFATMYNQFVLDNTSQVMTTSWGLAEPAAPGLFRSDEQIFMEAAAQGISMFAASGDHGAPDCNPSMGGYCPPGPNNADYPSSSGYIMAANGTELTISDTSGTYGNERAWADTGGAVSQFFDKPAWQIGPGVPSDVTMRMNSDIAMNAGTLHPYWVYTGVYPASSGGDIDYYGIAGTSAVAPQLAALFAIGVSRNGDVSLGQSNKLLYDDVNANAENYSTDFHDVTVGCNGELPDGAPSCAGTAWDHPTGWGSPRAASLLSHLGIQGPHGTITGTVTDINGMPIASAKVAATAGMRHGISDHEGNYSFGLPAGNYTITVTGYGYQLQTTTVTISDGATITLNFQLHPAPKATVSGHVTDGSGHGWGLYAELVASVTGVGKVADVWTDPMTGAYSMDLSEDSQYTLYVRPYFDYDPASTTFTLEQDITRDFTLLTPTCNAPGYHFSGLSEDFNADRFPPKGWTVAFEQQSHNIFWRKNTRLPGDHYAAWLDANYTGGRGRAAEVKGASIFYSGEPYDASLVSPEISVSDLPPDPQLLFKLNYQHHQNEALDVDVRVDGGNWQSAAHLTTSHGRFYKLPGVNYEVDLGNYIPPGTNHIQLRWRYYRLTQPDYDWYAQVDDIEIGMCQTLSGGLVQGQITDKNTGEGVARATVSNGTGGVVKAIENAADPNLPAGYYVVFVLDGEHTLTASARNYADASKTLNVSDNSMSEDDFALSAGRVMLSPTSLDVHVPVGGQQQATLTLHNSGSAPTHYQVVEANQPVPPTTPTGGAISLLSSRVFSSPETDEPGSPSSNASWCGIRDVCVRRTASPAAGTGQGTVVIVFDPGLQGTNGLGVNRDAGNLWIGSASYLSVGGDKRDHQMLFDGTVTGKVIDTSNLPVGIYAADMAYDDNTGMLWQAGHLNGNYCIRELDPVNRQITGRKICTNIVAFLDALAYDPLSNTWYAGGLGGRILHFDTSGRILDHKPPDVQIKGLTYNPANGHLFGTAWNARDDVYVWATKNNYQYVGSFKVPGLVGGAGAGLGHDCAGHLWATQFYTDVSSGYVFDFKAYEVNSGEADWCDFKALSWLSETPATGTIAAGAEATVTLHFDGSGQIPYPIARTQLLVRSTTPYGLVKLPITVHWDGQPVDLSLTGNAAPNPVVKGDDLIYTVTVKENGEGTATGTTLSYALSAGMNYVSGGGDGVICRATSSDSSSTFVAEASQPPLGTVSCNLGKLAQGASKTFTITVQPIRSGTLTSTFNVVADEPDDDVSDNTLMLQTNVIGKADLQVEADGAEIVSDTSRTPHFIIINAGPDTATGISVKLTSDANITFDSASASQGCTKDSDGFICNLGDLAPGSNTGASLTVSASSEVSVTVSCKATTTASDPNPDNNAAQFSFKITPEDSGGGGGGGGSSGSSGGGGFGWLALVALLVFVGIRNLRLVRRGGS